jgi:hypothetical protein
MTTTANISGKNIRIVPSAFFYYLNARVIYVNWSPEEHSFHG